MTTITITINGSPKTIDSALTLESVMNNEGYQNMTVAAAINENFVPKSQWAQTHLKDGDAIDIVAPMQGG